MILKQGCRIKVLDISICKHLDNMNKSRQETTYSV